MKNQMNFRIFSIISILSILMSVVRMPTTTAHATSAAFAGDGVFTFASMGDAQSEPGNFTTTLNQIATLNPDLALFNGDLENDGVDTPEMNPMVSALKSANLFNKTFLVRGNHDDHVSGSAALWESYFEADPKTLPAGVTNYTPIDANSTYLTYSFIYENSMFIGMDVPGDADLLTTAQLNWLDARLTDAESQGLTHAFIYFHGPMYCVEETHCECSDRTDGDCTPAALVTVINKHPIISAFLHGHEHLLAWTHMDNTRVAGLTGSFEQFITSPSGGWDYNEYAYPERLDYYYPDLNGDQGFGTVSVNGNSFTYSLYKDDIMTPVWSKTFTKGSTSNRLPAVTTLVVTAITGTTATGNGNISDLGIPTPTQYGVVWGTNPNPTIALSTKTQQGIPAGLGSFTSTITGLTPNTVYHVRAYATNTEGTAYGNDVTFTASTNYYVDKTVPCSDSWPGTFSQPFCTIQRGADVARAGNTVNVLHGTYADTVYLTDYSGTAGNPITFHAEPGVTVTGDSTESGSGFFVSSVSYVVIDGFNITETTYKGISVDSSNHITLSNNHVTYAGIDQGPTNHQQGIYLRNTTYSTITGNTTDHNSCIGIWLINHSDYNLISHNVSFSNTSTVAYPTVVISDAAGIDLTGSSHNTVINNIVYANEDSGINLYISEEGVPSTYNLVIGNLSYGNGDHGIDNNNSAYNTLIGNTVQGNGTVGINFEGDSASTGSHHATAINNISVGNGFTPPDGSFGGNLRVDSASVNGTTLDYNLLNRQSASVQIVWDNVDYTSLAAFRAAVSSQEVHGLEGNPLFLNPAPSVLRTNGDDYLIPINVGDYHLTAGSPAIDSANSGAPNEPETDIEGYIRVDDPATPNTGTGTRTYDDRGAYEFFPSGPSLSSVTTQAVTNITDTTATGNGNITALGVPNPTQYGLVWDTNPNPTIALSTKTQQGVPSGTGVFTSSLTGLSQGTLYHMRAYVTNAAGTVYGEDVTFTTVYGSSTTTPATNAGTGSSVAGVGTIAWSNPGNITTANSVYSTATLTANTISRYLQGTNYGFNIPANATIKGIAVTILRYTSGTTSPLTRDHVIRLIKSGTITGDNKAVTGTNWPTSNTAITYGSSSDLWGTTWTPADINASNFGVALAVNNTNSSSRTASVDYMQISVTYTVLTAPTAPTVTTQAVTAITTTTATGNGNITSLGIPNPTEHGVVWDTALNPTLADNKTEDGPVSVTGAFTSSITGLVPDTLYHVRTYATNSNGTAYGNDVTFTTLTLPIIIVGSVTDITATSATLNGTINPPGIPDGTEVGFFWGTSPNPMTNKCTVGHSAPGPFPCHLTGLTPLTLYYVRAYATNAEGTAYGEQFTFTTLGLLPTVTTRAVTNIAATTATGNGNISSLGIPNPTQYGVVWGTSNNPDITLTTKTQLGTPAGTGAFTSPITGLAQETLYHARAYVTNSVGTSYGEDVTFTTYTSSTITTPATNARSGTSVTGTGTVPWSNPGNITADDTSYATVVLNNATSRYLEGTNYGFAIPASAIINGIVVTIGRSENTTGSGNDVRDSIVRLIKAGVITGSNKAATTTEWPTSITAATYGTTSDLWGTTWTPADINLSNFGVALSANSTNNRTASVDYMHIAVTYTISMIGTSTSVNCGAGTPLVTYGSSLTCVATVTALSGTISPTNTVSWTTDGPGSFATSPCTLSGASGTASCSVTYTPTSVDSGSHLITGCYSGSGIFLPSCGSQTIPVNKKTASVTPNAAGKTYGEPDPPGPLTAILMGFLATDNLLTASCSREPGEDVGIYLITCTLTAPAGVLANYNITYNSADFAITAPPSGLTINIIGNGTVTKSPDQATYHYGDVVALTATPEPGWNFFAWNGAVTGGTNPIDVTIDGSDTVTATFTQDEYTLTIDIIGDGTVTKDPDQATYHYGDVVTLTATPGPEWTFDHWSGDATGGTTPITVTIHEDTAVTTTFVESQESVRHAKPGGLTVGACSSWDRACELSYALANAISGQEIWVAAGVYKPTNGTDRTVSFELKNGVAIYGGFDGTETERGQRDPAANETILSGDLLGNDSGFSNNGENSYHVMIGSNTDKSAVLDGFTIRGGNTNCCGQEQTGGGMYNEDGSPTLTDVTFSGNSAGDGGGMFNYSSSSPTLTDVTFSGNTATAGGGMYNYMSSNPTLINVTFSGNAASYGGGGMYNYTSSNPTLTNVTFSGNTADNRGGGMYNSASSSPTLTNVTFSGNTATDQGSGMYNSLYSSPLIDDTILWGDGTEVHNFNSTPTIKDSVVQGGCPSGASCTNVIDASPELGPLQNNGGLTETRALGAGSSAIDLGGVNSTCTATDQRGVVRPQGNHCDIGAYEAVLYTLGVMKSGTGSGTVTSSPSGTNCGADCSKPYPENTVITLTAIPVADSVFNGWEGCTSSNNTCSVTMDSDKTVTAAFTENTQGGTISPGETTLISVDSNGGQADQDSSFASISGNGSFMVFHSSATNLVNGDTNGVVDIFLRDVQNGSTTRISVSSSGTQANNTSSRPSISSDGRYIVYESGASNLVSGDTNNSYDIFMYDTQTEITTRVSNTLNNAQANSGSYSPMISSDGRYVTFYSESTNLVDGDTNGYADVFVRDLLNNTTMRVSVATDGTQANRESLAAFISSDGHYVLFSSAATNLTSGDTGWHWDAFVRDTQTNTTSRVSMDSNGTQGNNNSYGTAISSDGRYVSFHSDATNLTNGDSNGVRDVFLRDLQNNTTIPISYSDGLIGNAVSYGGNIAADGKYIVFASYASNLVDSDTNNTEDVFIYDRQTAGIVRVSLNTSGIQGNQSSYSPVISADGNYVAFTSTATNLVPGDNNGMQDIFLHRLDALITPVGAGVHDDANVAWTYSGDWGMYSGAGPYLDTLHYSTTVGDSAEVSFVGEQIQLTYTALVDRGVVDVYVDDEKVVTLNESGPGSWQQKWTSDPLGSGSHTVRLVHASGGIVDLDAITVIATANILSSGTYDDATNALLFTTNWYSHAGGGPYADSLHFSISAGEAAQFSFSGEQFGFTYTQMSGRGVMDVYIDGVKATSVNEEGPGAWQQRWISDPLEAGLHTVRLVHASGLIVDLDAIEVMSQATYLSAGSYDDGATGLHYSTNWYTHAGPGPAGDTLHFAFSPGESLLFSFSGEQFQLTYTQMADRGVVDVYVDGVKVASIDESGTGAWQQTWVSDPLSSGNHNVRLVQAGTGVVDIDAIQIIASASILSEGTYDDMNPAWHYTTYWYNAAGTGYYGGTLHFSINPKDQTVVSFSGTQFVLTYTEMSDRGEVDVYVDGVKVHTLDESGPGSYQKTWTSGVFASGTHTIRLVHASGPITDIDAITVLP